MKKKEPRNNTVCVRLTSEENERLEKLAEEQRRTKSEMVRICLETVLSGGN